MPAHFQCSLVQFSPVSLTQLTQAINCVSRDLAKAVKGGGAPFYFVAPPLFNIVPPSILMLFFAVFFFFDKIGL